MRSSDHYWEQSESVDCEIYLAIGRLLSCKLWIVNVHYWRHYNGLCTSFVWLLLFVLVRLNMIVWIICLTIQINVNTTHFGFIYFLLLIATDHTKKRKRLNILAIKLQYILDSPNESLCAHPGWVLTGWTFHRSVGFIKRVCVPISKRLGDTRDKRPRSAKTAPIGPITIQPQNTELTFEEIKACRNYFCLII